MKTFLTGSALALALMGFAPVAEAADGTFCSWGGKCTTRAEAEAAAISF